MTTKTPCPACNDTGSYETDHGNTVDPCDYCSGGPGPEPVFAWHKHGAPGDPYWFAEVGQYRAAAVWWSPDGNGWFVSVGARVALPGVSPELSGAKERARSVWRWLRLRRARLLVAED
jgi:hypothetical protein